MKTIHLFCSLLAVIILTVIIGGVEPPAKHANAQTSHVEAVQAPEKVETVNVATEAPKAQEVAETKPEQPKQPEPIGCGPHDAKLVYDILIEIGVPKLAAIQQVGSWQSESGFDQCQKRGDGGIAWGLNSWHPGRRADMPEELRAQITWAVKVEMPRDCLSCYNQFMAAESVWSVRDAIKRSTRWGIEAGRWIHADNFAQTVQ